jgi:hypothetical protein
MRIHSGVGRAGLGLILLAGCSTSEPIIETATVRIAPPTTAGPITEPLVLTIPKIVKTAPPTIPSTGPTTVPVDAAGSTLISGPTITEDEAAIKLVVGKVVKAELEKNFVTTFDPAPFEGNVTPKHLASIEAFFKKVQQRNLARKPGSITQVVTHDIEISKDGQTARAVSCDRNDIQVWDNKGNADPADDTLKDGALGVHATGMRLVRLEGKWLVESSIGIEVTFCDGIF